MLISGPTTRKGTFPGYSEPREAAFVLAAPKFGEQTAVLNVGMFTFLSLWDGWWRATHPQIPESLTLGTSSYDTSACWPCTSMNKLVFKGTIFSHLR